MCVGEGGGVYKEGAQRFQEKGERGSPRKLSFPALHLRAIYPSFEASSFLTCAARAHTPTHTEDEHTCTHDSLHTLQTLSSLLSRSLRAFFLHLETDPLISSVGSCEASRKGDFVQEKEEAHTHIQSLV